MKIAFVCTVSAQAKLILFMSAITAQADDKAGGEVRRLEGHEDKVTCVAFSPDGKTALSSSDDHTVRLWDVDSGKELLVSKSHGDYVLSIAFSPDGRRAVSAGGGIWDATKRFFFPGTDHALRLYDVSSGKVMMRLEDHSAPIWSVAFSPDGRFVLAGSGGYELSGGSPVFRDGRPVSAGHELRLWDAATGESLLSFGGHTNWVRSVAFSPDGKTAVSGSWDTTARIWDLGSGEQLRVIKHAGPVDAVAVSPDGQRLLTGGGPLGAGGDTDIHVWELSTGKELRRLVGHTKRIWSLTFSPDGRHALSASSDRSIRLWDVESGRAMHQFDGHTDEVRRAVFSPDGRRMLSASHDRTIRLWNLPD